MAVKRPDLLDCLTLLGGHGTNHSAPITRMTDTKTTTVLPTVDVVVDVVVDGSDVAEAFV